VNLSVELSDDVRRCVLRCADTTPGACLKARQELMQAGTSGNLSERVVLVIASGRNLPNLMNSIDPARLSNDAWTWPPRRSESMGAVPRYGTWSKLMPAIALNSSPAK